MSQNDQAMNNINREILVFFVTEKFINQIHFFFFSIQKKKKKMSIKFVRKKKRTSKGELAFEIPDHLDSPKNDDEPPKDGIEYLMRVRYNKKMEKKKKKFS